MTHPQTAALTALLMRVEAGDDFTGDALNRAVDAMKSFAPSMTTYEFAVRFRDAQRGSLDAAKALHDALLGDGNISTPGYMATVYMSGKAAVWDIISGASHRGEVTAPSLHAVSPARAWLIATPADTEGR